MAEEMGDLASGVGVAMVLTRYVMRRNVWSHSSVCELRVGVVEPDDDTSDTATTGGKGASFLRVRGDTSCPAPAVDMSAFCLLLWFASPWVLADEVATCLPATTVGQEACRKSQQRV